MRGFVEIDRMCRFVNIVVLGKVLFLFDPPLSLERDDFVGNGARELSVGWHWY